MLFQLGFVRGFFVARYANRDTHMFEPHNDRCPNTLFFSEKREIAESHGDTFRLSLSLTLFYSTSFVLFVASRDETIKCEKSHFILTCDTVPVFVCYSITCRQNATPRPVQTINISNVFLKIAEWSEKTSFRNCLSRSANDIKKKKRQIHKI